MSDIPSIHDNFIRSILSDKQIAVDYFRNYLPASVSEHLDFNSLKQLPDAYISGDLKKTMSDIVYSCRRKDRKGEVRVSLLIEHKSYVDKHAPIQIGSYIFSGWLRQIRNNEKLSPIIPILLYHGAEKWEYRTLSALFKDQELDASWKKYLPDFDYIYNNLGEVPNERIASVEHRFLRASIYLLKYSADEIWLGEHVLELLTLLDDASFNLTRGFFVYLSQQSNLEWTKIIEVMEELPPASKKKVVTFADYFREKGIQKGREDALSEKNRLATINMIRKGFSDSDICEILEVTPEYVSLVRAELASTGGIH